MSRRVIQSQRLILALSILVVLTSPALADDCQGVETERQAIEALITQGDLKQAKKQAKALTDRADGCAAAHMALASVYRARLNDAGGLKALSAARTYRRALADALAIEPDNLDARTDEIGFLINAPSIAGGSRDKAALRIAELRSLDPVRAAQMQVMAAKAEGDTDVIMAALSDVLALTPQDHAVRSEYVRRLILADKTDKARTLLDQWPEPDMPDDWLVMERLYLQAAARVYAVDDLAAAERMLTEYIARRPSLDEKRLSPVAHAYALLGSARLEQGDVEGADPAFQQALSGDPDNERALAGLARIAGEADPTP
ncbi:tetratricopeptide repeat protein [Algimonas porphyrae]|uniref:Tetratricopeptide repeat protein n=1 Tax=Algimonas porphyrae TaxID=1128113 RepID=A0ABQ5V408_9PROT|nr:tetratricopeptide repeat protein [Algimonas porphyrae]GLQ21593.1 hypothetical protein GCM10007854_25480 [Algimonas porphyrae]